MQLFYAPDLEPPYHTLDEEESKHCIRVLRLGVGGRLHLTDGRGNLYEAEITDADPRRCTVRVVATHAEFEKMPYALTMGVAPTKNPDRFEWFLEKAAHSERRTFKAQRSEKVITAAMKQSLKAYRPTLRELTPLREFVARPFAGRSFIAHCAAARSQGGKAFLASALRPGEAVRILIGPEGDFSAEEIDFALAHGFGEITLGPQRLRTETAALTAVIMAATVNGPLLCGE